MFYFACHCVGSQFELFRPQPLKYSVSTATHLAHVILFQSFCERHATSTLKRVARAYCDSFVFARIQSNGFPTHCFARHIISLHGSLAETVLQCNTNTLITKHFQSCQPDLMSRCLGFTLSTGWRSTSRGRRRWRETCTAGLCWS